MAHPADIAQWEAERIQIPGQWKKRAGRVDDRSGYAYTDVAGHCEMHASSDVEDALRRWPAEYGRWRRPPRLTVMDIARDYGATARLTWRLWGDVVRSAHFRFDDYDMPFREAFITPAERVERSRRMQKEVE